MIHSGKGVTILYIQLNKGVTLIKSELVKMLDKVDVFINKK